MTSLTKEAGRPVGTRAWLTQVGGREIRHVRRLGPELIPSCITVGHPMRRSKSKGATSCHRVDETRFSRLY
jgi:hypothetical protein